jgi:hypothetical protein
MWSRLLDWLAFRIMDVAALIDRDVWMRTKYERRLMREWYWDSFPRGEWMTLERKCHDGWRNERYV